jgi:transcriptional regulator with XRE-family HTH domain
MSRVKDAREAKKMERNDLAAKAGISREYVRLLESENPPTPGLDVARAIARALGTSIDKLFPQDQPARAAR